MWRVIYDMFRDSWCMCQGEIIVDVGFQSVDNVFFILSIRLFLHLGMFLKQHDPKTFCFGTKNISARPDNRPDICVFTHL